MLSIVVCRNAKHSHANSGPLIFGNFAFNFVFFDKIDFFSALMQAHLENFLSLNAKFPVFCRPECLAFSLTRMLSILTDQNAKHSH